MFKKISSLFIIGLAIISLSSCQKEEPLKEVEDVCTEMEDLSFMRYCYDNYDVNKDGAVSIQEASSVVKMDVRNLDIYSLKGLEYFTNLKELRCNGNNITELIVSNSELTIIWCAQNQLSNLDVSKAVSLRELKCGQNRLILLDLSKNVSLETLDCCNNQLPFLDLSKNVHLSYLNCINNNLTSLDLSNNVDLWPFRGTALLLDDIKIYCNPQNNGKIIQPLAPDGNQYLIGW